MKLNYSDQNDCQRFIRFVTVLFKCVVKMFSHQKSSTDAHNEIIP